MMQGKIAIVGGAETIAVFKAAGVAAFPVTDVNSARETLRRAAREYQIVFLAEEYAAGVQDLLKRFDEEAYPVILPIPSGKETGYGEQFLRNCMERALGVDILFQK